MNLIRLQEDLKSDEGVVYHIYLDHLGFKTFGIGHLVSRVSDPEWEYDVGQEVSYERVHSCFVEDIAIATRNCRRLYGEGFEAFPDEVQEILVNMIFNLGYSGLKKFKKMNKALDTGDWAEAAIEGRDSRWYGQVTNRAERLMTRLENMT